MPFLVMALNNIRTSSAFKLRLTLKSFAPLQQPHNDTVVLKV